MTHLLVAEKEALGTDRYVSRTVDSMVVMWGKLVDGKTVDEIVILMAAWTELNAVEKMAFP